MLLSIYHAQEPSTTKKKYLAQSTTAPSLRNPALKERSVFKLVKYQIFSSQTFKENIGKCQGLSVLHPIKDSLEESDDRL